MVLLMVETGVVSPTKSRGADQSITLFRTTTDCEEVVGFDLTGYRSTTGVQTKRALALPSE